MPRCGSGSRAAILGRSRLRSKGDRGALRYEENQGNVVSWKLAEERHQQARSGSAASAVAAGPGGMRAKDLQLDTATR